MARTTLQYRIKRQATIDADPVEVVFFESEVGLAWLHRIVIALHLVFTQAGPCGIRLVSQFLELSRLDRFVAASYGTQQKISRQMQRALFEYAGSERTRLAGEMPEREITLAQDETFHPEPCLVAIEPISDYIVLEKYAADRKAETWNEAVKGAVDGLKVKVIQTTSDEAQGLLAHAREGLGAHHSPDLFHPQRDLSKASSLALERKVAEAGRVMEEAGKQKLEAEEERREYLSGPPRGGFPPNFTRRIAEAEEAQNEARKQVQAAEERRDRMKAAIKGLGVDYHPYDLTDARTVSAEEAERRLKARFAEIDRVAEEANLSEGSRQRIEKARRLLASFVATIAFFHLRERKWVGELALSPEVEEVVRGQLIPALYLQRAAKKLRTTEERAKVAAVYQPILARVRDPVGVLSRLTAEERGKVERVAQDCADLFQRSSSCVEGRNGQLSLRHHSLRRLTAGKLAALTVIHNYYATRSDGTTAAERFFGAKPKDLFGWLLDRLEAPARPAAKRSDRGRKAA